MMTMVSRFLVWWLVASSAAHCAHGLLQLAHLRVSRRELSRVSAVLPPPGGVAPDGPPDEMSEASFAASPSNTFQNRGKVNEIDFCMAPSDVSLSRSYGSVAATAGAVAIARGGTQTTAASANAEERPRILSLTRALNSVSNRAVRRILLSRSWPSTEALNRSLRQVLLSSKDTAQRKDQAWYDNEMGQEELGTIAQTSTAKCPVPRPILNIIMRRRNDIGTSIDASSRDVILSSSSFSTTVVGHGTPPQPTVTSKRGRSDAEWVADQLAAFRASYGQLAGYELANAYLECILSLATSGTESTRVSEVLLGEVYDESYRRVIAILKSAGAVFETIPETSPPRQMIASKLIDQSICLSVLDKIAIKNEKKLGKRNVAVKQENQREVFPVDAETNQSIKEESVATESATQVDFKSSSIPLNSNGAAAAVGQKENKLFLNFFSRYRSKSDTPVVTEANEKTTPLRNPTLTAGEPKLTLAHDEEELEPIKPEDLGAVLLSAEEPTMTRQLNVLSNIVKRALLFGGDQELLVLSETLEADKPAFIQRWYANTDRTTESDDLKCETRPGVQYFNCLVQLLNDCYGNGVVTDLAPSLPLSKSYANAYERLTTLLVERGSGYIKPITARRMLSVVPKTPKEEFGRFAQWEVAMRQTSSDITAYPDDLVGSWQVRDEIGRKTIGTSTVVLKPEGEVYVTPPLTGLRWRLDPGPTHLDTCTFQVLSDDGAILQYRGFVDRGARLEARFSKRSIKIRGAVTFQMRDGESAYMSDDYKRDMLPLNYQTGTTRFVMSKVFDLDNV